MKTNRALLIKGLKYFLITVFLMFLGPVVLYQAFKNQEHPWYLPVLITGLVLAAGAIVMGFISVKTMVDGFFSREE